MNDAAKARAYRYSAGMIVVGLVIIALSVASDSSPVLGIFGVVAGLMAGAYIKCRAT